MTASDPPAPAPPAAADERAAQRRRVAEILAATRLQVDLLGIVAHDLRNPLGAARLGVELLRETVLPPDRKPAADRILSTLDRATGILEAIEVDAGGKGGRPRLDRRREDLGALVAAVVEAQAEELRVRGLTVDARTPSLHAEVDLARLIQPIHALLTHASQVSPRGGTIGVFVVGTDDGVRVEVDDAGPPLQVGEAAGLFQPFSAERSRTGRPAGMSLHVARRMVELHGGRVGALGLPRGGARLWFEVPRTAPA